MYNERNENLDIFEKELSPTFLYTWKHLRIEHENNYHSHDFIEIAFILSGKSKYRIQDRIFEVSEGDLLILNPGVKHDAIVIEETNLHATEFFVAFTDIWLRNYPKNYLPLPDPDSFVIHTSGMFQQTLSRLCASMEAESMYRRQGNYEMMKSYLVQMLLLIIREQYEPVKNTGAYTFQALNKKYIVEQILKYFEDHYDEKISLEQIAENMYLSPFYISKIFKSETGNTPINHLIQIRLEKSKELLLNGSSIKEAALVVGYEDAYHFSKLFKKHYGISPSKVKQAEH